MTQIDRDGHTAEGIVEAELRRHGREVLNLNRDIAGNHPVVDLIARRDAERILIQVRGTTNDHGSYTIPPARPGGPRPSAPGSGCRSFMPSCT
jgi:predicted AAA+ superfamily ATPase